MKQVFIRTLIESARKNRKIFLLTGDLGFSVFESFQKEFPDRFINMGVAEQNMIGVAAGLALSGKIVFAYSIIPFITMRPFEQIRNDICYQNLNVRLIGTGSGLSYGTAGMTHHALEDIAVMRSLINMTIVAPSGPQETALAVSSTITHKGPVYIRLGRGDETAIIPKPNFKIGKGIILENGRDLTIISYGGMLHCAKQVAAKLKERGFSVRLISMPTIKPLDGKMVLESARHTKAIFSIEEHSIIGGLGTAISELLAESTYDVLFKRIALPDQSCTMVGEQKFLLEQKGLSADRITKRILKTLREQP